jgi:CxxC-x17-CxxC domain-containing protein
MYNGLNKIKKYMPNFNKGGRGGFRGGDRGRDGRKPSFRGGDRGGRSGFGGRGGRSERPEMHSVICDKCGKNCQVPFKPSSDKPVFCDECFGGKRDTGRDNFRGGERSERKSFDREPRKEYSSPKEIDLKRYFEEINTKLDKLVFILEKSSQKNVTTEKEIKEKKPKVKKVVAKKTVIKKKIKS